MGLLHIEKKTLKSNKLEKVDKCNYNRSHVLFAKKGKGRGVNSWELNGGGGGSCTKHWENFENV